MKRNPRKVRWTKAFRKTHAKEMAMDSTLEMEKRRNRPPKYDREQMRTTLKAMKRIAEIKKRRDDDFYQARMASKKAQKIQDAHHELEKYRNTIPDVVRYRNEKEEMEAEEETEKLEEKEEVEKIEEIISEPIAQKKKEKKSLKVKRKTQKMELE